MTGLRRLNSRFVGKPSSWPELVRHFGDYAVHRDQQRAPMVSELRPGLERSSANPRPLRKHVKVRLVCQRTLPDAQEQLFQISEALWPQLAAPFTLDITKYSVHF
jgi:hypothetical protein